MSCLIYACKSLDGGPNNMDLRIHWECFTPDTIDLRRDEIDPI